MQFDLSAVDTELDALGREAAEALQLAERYAGPIKSLADADAVLATLGQPMEPRARVPALALTRRSVPAPPPAYPSFADEDDEPLRLSSDELAQGMATLELTSPGSDSAPPPASGPSTRAPQSGELALPEPVKRPDPNPISGELDLSASEPTSGSFALPAQEEPPVGEPVFAPPSQSGPPAPLHSEAPEVNIDEVLDEDDDALFAELESIPAAPTPVALRGLGELPLERPRSEGRDPDAEFEAIFSDATSPSGIPTRGFGFSDDESPSAEELLTGLEAAPEEPKLEPEDRTEIIDSKTLGSITQSATEDIPFQDEVGSTEFEILMEDDVESEESSPPAKNSPPPPPQESLNKPPSFLGRLFGRKDQSPSE